MSKKRYLKLGAVVLMIITILAGCNLSGGQAKITVSEAIHSPFYAPFYVAIEKGYFKEEGIKLVLSTVSGTEQAKASLMAEKCDVALMGPEACINAYNEGVEDYPVCFAQLTQRAGEQLLSRIQNEDFDWNNLVGKTVLGGNEGSMPSMVFEYVLKKQGLNPKKDLTILENDAKEQVTQTFYSGEGDYILLSEPEATTCELEGKGKIVASLGEISGKTPYSVLAAKKSEVVKYPEQFRRFTAALQKGIDYVLTHTPEETAKELEAQFPETDYDSLVLMLTCYYEQDTWKGNLILEEGSYVLLVDLMMDSEELKQHIPYQDIINTEYAKEAFSKE